MHFSMKQTGKLLAISVLSLSLNNCLNISSNSVNFPWRKQARILFCHKVDNLRHR